jgi:hypothetical protein
MAYDPADRTRILARIVGPYLIVLGAMLLVRGPTLDLMLPAFMQDGPLVLAAGAFTLMAGLTMFALHHHWTSAPAVVLTLIAIVAALKGAMLMIAPELGATLSVLVARTPPLLVVVALIVLVIGAWLAFVGWSAKETSAK